MIYNQTFMVNVQFEDGDDTTVISEAEKHALIERAIRLSVEQFLFDVIEFDATVTASVLEDNGTIGQDRESYTDDQDRESYTVEKGY